MNIFHRLLRGAMLGILTVSPQVGTAQSALWDWSGTVEGTPATAPLRAMLAQVPAAYLLPSGDLLASLGFGDFDAARRVLASLDSDLPLALRAANRAAPTARLTMEMGAETETWINAVGFSVADIHQMVVHENRTDAASLIALSPDAAARVPDALLAAGYGRQGYMGLHAYAAGEDGGRDREAGRSGDPFRSFIGLSARVDVAGPLLRHGRTWSSFSALAYGARSPAVADPVVRVQLDALDGLDAGALLQATFHPEAAPLLQSDPVAALRGTDAERDAGGWRSLLLADFSTGAVSTGVMVLTADWPADLDPAPLAALITARWNGTDIAGRSAAAQLGVPVEVNLWQTADGLVVLRLAATTPTVVGQRGVTTNPVYAFFSQRLRMLDLNFLP